MKKEYLVSLVFFVESDDVSMKDKLVSELKSLKFVDVIEVYNDGEDWNIECEVSVKCNNINNIDFQLLVLLPSNAWDYHYIKGIDNDFYWQP